jgi:hypothetical protein
MSRLRIIPALGPLGPLRVKAVLEASFQVVDRRVSNDKDPPQEYTREVTEIPFQHGEERCNDRYLILAGHLDSSTRPCLMTDLGLVAGVSVPRQCKRNCVHEIRCSIISLY